MVNDGIRFPQINYRINRLHDPIGANFRIVIYVQGIHSGEPATSFSNVGDFYTDPTNLSISAKSNYTVSYNANNGSNPPTNQTKWYNENLTLSSTRPTRTGYTFKGWSTTQNGSVSYQPGGSFNSNANTTLWAVWQINTHTITYNANGGSGAPGSTTKNYGQAQTVSSTKPTRMNYDFKGWSLSQNGAAQYSGGQTISDYTNHTLYAVWEYRTDLPTITNLSIERCETDGTLSDEGKTGLISFDWSAPRKCKQIKITFTGLTNVVTKTYTSEEDKKSDHYSAIVCQNLFLMENSYKVIIAIDDYDNGETIVSGLLTKGADVPIDVYKDGKGVAFGKYAEEENVMDVNFKARYWKGQKMWETDNTSNTQRWHYLGQVQINRQGDYAHFKIFGGDGQNSELWQNMLMDIILKKGFQSEPSTTKYVGVTYTVHKMNHHKYNTDDVKVKVLCRTVGYAEVYVYFSWSYSTIRYTVDGVFDDFIRGNMTEMTTLPTDGVEQPCIGGVVPILYNGDLTTIRSFRIPKNGDQGYGLCNSDGVSIIRDFNNRNVTVDATGNELFLGFQNTVGINILDGRAKFDGNGHLLINSGNSYPSRIFLGNRNANLGDTELRTQSKSLDIGIGNDAAGAFRIWNFTHSKDVLRCNSSGVNTFNGHANGDVALKSQIWYGSWHSIVLTRSDDTWLNIMLYGSNTLKEGSYSIANDFKLYTIGKSANVELTIPRSAIASINRADWGFEVNVRRSGISGDTQGGYNGIAIVSSGNLVLRST